MDGQHINVLKLVGYYLPLHLRGILNTAWGFVITVFICTWTANHVNVPPYGSASRWRLPYKIKIILPSLLTPGCTASVVAVDLRADILLMKRIRKLGFEKWTLKQSFFLGIGRCMIESERQYTLLDVDAFVEQIESGPLLAGSSDSPVKEIKGIVTKYVSETAAEHVDGTRTSEKELATQSGARSLDDVVVLPFVTKLDIYLLRKGLHFLPTRCRARSVTTSNCSS